MENGVSEDWQILQGLADFAQARAGQLGFPLQKVVVADFCVWASCDTAPDSQPTCFLIGFQAFWQGVAIVGCGVCQGFGGNGLEQRYYARMMSPLEPRNKLLTACQTQLPPYPDDLNMSFGRSAVAPSPRTREATNQ